MESKGINPYNGLKLLIWGTWWSSGRILAMQPNGSKFKSDRNHCVGTFLTSFALTILNFVNDFMHVNNPM